ncbi:PREDICTED: aminoacyl tRNA synthase complex-interacting multifunctional protein 1-like isoform X1 [Branchiostoma belcheri]|uniref:Aminoacyl tRNA synthase complex-interacting multifunctional protein 1-like isoform X1 n=2 Tax=Branchiostoma belcheri TaxID=7741 RepID=A0A6P5AW85_BRABE|nr:PREDICTED: aminoacyl tRNA synthase complex-interacting multifunctional protein 1-like isoform X1 [Branchiostoma belcheri]XP_019647338.1 PREDICTED: aminoacyl tRNA synthase complex-interacting multifunctional protein 1-like isoform X1 [Branchiostoma belcheri]
MTFYPMSLLLSASSRLLVRSVLRMASPEVVQRLEQRARQADEAINILKTQIQMLKQHAVTAEEQRLKKENDQLRQQVNDLKAKLTMAEIQNGVQQVYLPVRTAATDTEAPAAQPQTAEPAPKPAEAKPEQKQVQKGGKADKAAGKGEKKEKKGGEKKKGGPPQEEKPVDVSRLDMRIGRIVSVKKHPDADTLYVEEIDVGETAPRTVVSGLVKHVPMEEMQDRIVIAMCNLKPAKMRGITSQAMVMCASSPDKVELLDPPAGSQPGDRITFEGYPGEPDPVLQPKKKVWETVQPDLQVTSDKVATYKGVPFTVAGKGVCTAKTMTNSGIK